MILIDSLYLNSFGGETILKLFLNQFKNTKIDLFILIDSRLPPFYLNLIEPNNYKVINASHFNRKRFYLENKDKFSSILCLANLPPPIFINVKTTIYFHNLLLLHPFSHSIRFKNRLVNYFKFSYIKHHNHNDYIWVVQTQYICKLLRDSLKINSEQVFIYPIFKEKFKLSRTKKTTNNFVYVSSGVSHKNHNRLLKAFIEAANKTDKEINLHLTLDKEELSFIKKYPKNLNIVMHGTLSEDGVNRLYNFNEFLIYPSLVESFGLPLIEATIHGCKVIASDLPYVHEIIKPSFTFDPYSAQSISNAILKAVERSNLPETKILVENKLDNFIDYIISQDVQR